MNLKPEITPNTYIVREISIFEYMTALALYLSSKQKSI